MKRLAAIVIGAGVFISGASLAEAHAFIDHAEPRVGSTVEVSPSVVKIWFTDGLREKGSEIDVFNAKGQRVDKGDIKIDRDNKTIMVVSVQKLSAGTYKVAWRATCPLGHHTEGSFMFDVKS